MIFIPNLELLMVKGLNKKPYMNVVMGMLPVPIKLSNVSRSCWKRCLFWDWYMRC